MATPFFVSLEYNKIPFILCTSLRLLKISKPILTNRPSPSLKYHRAHAREFRLATSCLFLFLTLPLYCPFPCLALNPFLVLSPFFSLLFSSYSPSTLSCLLPFLVFSLYIPHFLLVLTPLLSFHISFPPTCLIHSQFASFLSFSPFLSYPFSFLLPFLVRSPVLETVPKEMLILQNIRAFAPLSIGPSLCPFVHLSVHTFFHQFIRPSIHLSFHPPQEGKMHERTEITLSVLLDRCPASNHRQLQLCSRGKRIVDQYSFPLLLLYHPFSLSPYICHCRFMFYPLL